MKPIYKKVALQQAHCPDCGEQLMGNNSIALPWNCLCGVWKIDLSTTTGTAPFDYIITPKGAEIIANQKLDYRPTHFNTPTP